MPTIEDQLLLERGMIDRGIAQATNSFRAAEEGGRVADTSYGKALTRQFLPGLVDDIELYCSTEGATRFGKYRVLLRMLDADRAALLALRGVFQDPFSDRALPGLAKLIGTMIEDEVKFTRFEADHKEYYTAVIKDFKNKNTTSYSHRHRVLTFKMREKEVAWNRWTADEKLHVGMILLDRILATTDLIEKTIQRRGAKTHAVVALTAEAVSWIEQHKDHMALLSPQFMPTVIEPDEWSALDIGGYYSADMRRRCQLVKTRSPIHKEILRSSDLSLVMRGANILQRTPWRVNRRVHDVVKDVWTKGLRIGMGSPDPIDIPKSPVHHVDKKQFTDEQQTAFDEWRREAAYCHTLEKDRVKKNFQIIRLMRGAENYRSYDQFWYVWQTDFRGRFYPATAGFSPQGPDMGKGLLEFANPQPLGEEGFRHLKVHYANLCGFDKESFDERVSYTDQRQAAILSCALEPLGESSTIWTDADKQYCALAAVFELAAAYRGGADSATTRLPIARDGSCNGLQHYAAILRDETGAEATNVVDVGRVADIYSEVGRVAWGRVLSDMGRSDIPEVARLWSTCLSTEGTVPRKLTKKPVMTLPYGATRRSCCDSVLDWLMLEDRAEFPPGTRMQPALYMTGHIWDAIGEVVTSARAAMDWLRSASSLMAKKGEPLIWITPTGFPVYQGTNRVKMRRIRTQLGGDLHLSVGDFTDEFDPRKQAAGAPPNYIHSMDASHLLMTILRAHDAGVTDFAVVHDSFGTHGNNTTLLDTSLRQAFVELYIDREPLQEFREAQEVRTGIELPDPPQQGSLDIQRVMDSPYFFA